MCTWCTLRWSVENAIKKVKFKFPYFKFCSMGVEKAFGVKCRFPPLHAWILLNLTCRRTQCTWLYFFAIQITIINNLCCLCKRMRWVAKRRLDGLGLNRWHRFSVKPKLRSSVRKWPRCTRQSQAPNKNKGLEHNLRFGHNFQLVVGHNVQLGHHPGLSLLVINIIFEVNHNAQLYHNPENRC